MSVRIAAGEATRERLLLAARELFTERGYQDASIQDVLDRTGVSRGALYHHFATKEQLFEAVLEQVETEIEQELIAATSTAEPGIAALRAGSAAWFRLVLDPSVQRIAMIDAPTAVGWNRWREIDEEHGLGLLRAALTLAARAGRLPADLVDYYARIILAASMELGMVIATAPDPAAAQAAAQRAMDNLLTALLS
jgi:AcrR family transcriptional regulator